MNEDQLQELLANTLASFKQELLQEVNSTIDQKNQGLASAINKTVAKKLEAVPQPKTEERAQPEDNTQENKDRLTLKALQLQISDLTNQLQEKDRAAFEADKRAAISRVIAESPAINKSLLNKVFSLEYGSKLAKEGDQWFFDNGENVTPIDQLLSNYLNTSDEGKGFLPPSNSQGSGAVESKPQVSNSKEPLNLDTAWAEVAAKLS